MIPADVADSLPPGAGRVVSRSYKVQITGTVDQLVAPANPGRLALCLSLVAAGPSPQVKVMIEGNEPWRFVVQQYVPQIFLWKDLGPLVQCEYRMAGGGSAIILYVYDMFLHPRG